MTWKIWICYKIVRQPVYKKKLNFISCHPNGTVRERCYFWEGLIWVNIITVRFLTNLYELYFLLVDKFNQILFIRHLFTLVDKQLDRNLIRQGSPKKEIISLSKMPWGNSVLDLHCLPVTPQVLLVHLQDGPAALLSDSCSLPQFYYASSFNIVLGKLSTTTVG